MQCELCSNPATVHLTEIVDGHKAERHLCDQCAQNEGITIKSHMPIGELLNNLVEAHREAQDLEDLSCPQCDITWPEFRKRGLLGCPNDYVAFEQYLGPLIKQAQEGATAHTGRLPRRADAGPSRQLKLLRLRQDLRRAVEEEEYEVAARLRDEISSLTSN